MNESSGARVPGTPGDGAAGTKTNGIVDKVRDTAAAQLTNQKNRATDGLGSVVQAVRQSTQQLRDQDHDVIARYVEQAADQIERVSQQIRNKEVGELMSDVQRLARRQPALFIGGAFALGLIGARFFKSSARDQFDDNYPTSSQPGLWRGDENEYRGYAQAGGATSYATADVSRVHDYQSSGALGEEFGSQPASTGTPGVSSGGTLDSTLGTTSETPTGSRGASTAGRTRRGTQSERS